MIKKMRITVNGKTYDVEAEILDNQKLETPLSAAPAAVERSAGTVIKPAAVPQPKPVMTPSGTPGEIPSPIAGIVVSISISEGDVVAAGDVLMALEVMKMITEITAPCAGKVTKVNVNQGQSVEEGQPLMTVA